MDQHLMPELSIEVFGELIGLGVQPAVAGKLSRAALRGFCLRDAWLGDDEANAFIAAIATTYPTLTESRNLVTRIREQDSRPVVICLETIDFGLRNAYRANGIYFASEDGNAYLPFLGMQQVPTAARRKPAPLSPQAQRIALNLIAGRWDGCSASELANLTHKSRSSVTNYLKEIEAICPALLKASWRIRMLGNPGYSKDELLDIFEPYLRSPVKSAIRLARTVPLDALLPCEPKLSGESALPFFSDLAHDPSQVTLMMGQDDVVQLKAKLGSAWREAAWNERAPLIIEEWSYPLDATSSRSLAATNLKCADPFSLYAELMNLNQDDERIHDAIEQLREYLCRS